MAPETALRDPSAETGAADSSRKRGLTATPEPALLQGVPYIGGKSQAGVWQRIINLIPPHARFFEMFAGSAAIARLKLPAAETVLIEKSEYQSSLLRVEFNGRARVIHGDAIDLLERPEKLELRPEDFIYCDPPYVLATRGGRRYYEHELEDPEHVRLIRAAIAAPCMVLLSGYPSALYDRLGFSSPPKIPGWSSETFTVENRQHRKATECLWFNYPRPAELHDFRRVGENFRERWRIEKRRRRWKLKMERLPTLERAALFSVLADVMATTAAARAETGAGPRSAADQGAAPGPALVDRDREPRRFRR